MGPHAPHASTTMHMFMRRLITPITCPQTPQRLPNRTHTRSLAMRTFIRRLFSPWQELLEFARSFDLATVDDITRHHLPYGAWKPEREGCGCGTSDQATQQGHWQDVPAHACTLLTAGFGHAKRE